MKPENLRRNCIIELGKCGSCFTYVVANRLRHAKVEATIKTPKVLSALKQLQKLGYVTSDKSGSGYFWMLTDSGRDYYKAITEYK